MVALALVSPAETCNCARGRARKTWRAFKTLDRRSYWLCRHSLRQPKQGCLRECNGSNAPVRCKAADNACSQKISRRTLGLCAASLALSVRPVPRRVLISCSAEDGHRSLSMQIAQPLRPAEAKHVGSYDLAATNQQALPEATASLQPVTTATKFKPGQKQVLAINKRVQTQNNAPLGFPNFVRDGYEIVILADGYQESQDGLIWKDFEEGKGSLPQDGQQVTFDYTAYNESGARIDSTYQKGRPAQTRLGINGLIPGFEKGIKTMRVGGKRRLVVSPALGPPVGPSTFFSAKQCEVFDVELLDVKSCRRRQVAMFSDVVCE